MRARRAIERDQFERRVDASAGRDFQHEAALGEGAVEVEQGVARALNQALQPDIVLQQRTQADAGHGAQFVRQFAAEKTVHRHDPEAIDRPELFFRPRQRRGVGFFRARGSGAQFGAQVGVMPRLDAPRRQAEIGEAVEGRPAFALCFSGGEAREQVLFGLGRVLQDRAHHAASSA